MFNVKDKTMKTTTIHQTEFPIRLVFLVIFLLLFGTITVAQRKKDISKYLEGLPKDLELIENTPQTYGITTDYFNWDLYGNFVNKTRAYGEYTRGLENGHVSWKNVSIAWANNEEGSFPEGEKQAYMEGFEYVPSAEMVQADVFKDFPPNSFHTRNLVWDMMAIEGFAWGYFDSLELNEEYEARDINGEVDLAGEGTFENKDIRLTWMGLTEMHNEPCAVIYYQTMHNPLKIENDFMKMKGRSHYWGTIWVSLEDKQIEHALMYEDVVTEMTMEGQPGTQQFNATRKIVFEKLTLEL